MLPPTITAMALAEQLATRIEDTIPSSVKTNPEWTLGIKRILSDMAGDFKCRYTDRERKNKEFLVDVVWLGTGHEMALAVECEWSLAPAEHRKDFEKLLYLKCPLKLFIHQRLQVNWKDVFTRSLREYHGHVKGEEYIFIRVPYGKQLTCCRFPVTVDGPLTGGAIEFEDVCSRSLVLRS